jgi:hypothetical protein
MAVGEQALPQWQAVIEQLTPILEEINRLSDEATEQVRASDARGAGFAGRLAVAERFGAALEEPANKLVELGNSYASKLVEVDPAILAMIRMLEEDPTQLESEDVTETLDSIQQFAVVARESAESTRHLSDVYGGIANLSRTLRAPVRKIQQGLRAIIDGQSIIDEWDERITALRRNSGSQG